MNFKDYYEADDSDDDPPRLLDRYGRYASDEEADEPQYDLWIPAFSAFNRKRQNRSNNSAFQRNKRTPFTGRPVNFPLPSRRSEYWHEDGSGPVLTQCKFAGNTLDLPKVAPLHARTEDKKVILVTTAKRLSNASGKDADWAAKTDFLVGRFLGLTPHASNEADSCLIKFKEYSSDTYVYSRPTGLGPNLQPAPLNSRLPGLRYLMLEMRVYPKSCVD
jgi:hypothetical protein